MRELNVIHFITNLEIYFDKNTSILSASKTKD